jgi:hypothetical protein
MAGSSSAESLAAHICMYAYNNNKTIVIHNNNKIINNNKIAGSSSAKSLAAYIYAKPILKSQSPSTIYIYIYKVL